MSEKAKMTRRQGVIASLAGMIGIMTGTQTDAGTTAPTLNIFMPKGGVTMNLDGYTEFTFTCGEDSITLKPEEVMAALKSA